MVCVGVSRNFAGTSFVANMGFKLDHKANHCSSRVHHCLFPRIWLTISVPQSRSWHFEGPEDDTDYSAGKEKMTAPSIHEIRTIDIKLDGYGLDIQKCNGLLKKTPSFAS